MTDTKTPEDGTTEADHLSVLVIDDSQSVRTTITDYAHDHYSDVEVTAVSDGASALDRLTATQMDCLVVEPAALDRTGALFGAAVEEITSTCPVVWLTRLDPSDLDDTAVAAGTTIVEKYDDNAE